MKRFSLHGDIIHVAEDGVAACVELANAIKALGQVGNDNEIRVLPGIDETCLMLECLGEVPIVPAAVPKCPACGGRGFIEYNHGLLQVKCSECNGTGLELTDVITYTADGPFEEQHADIDLGSGQPDKPARKPYTRKSTKPRKRPKSRKA